MTQGQPLLETVHGSHLYGLNHDGSDHDAYRVVSSWNRSRKNDVLHKVRGRDDLTVVGLSTFMRFCEEGVPQALEAMFSPVATIDEITELRSAYRVGTPMRRTYMRTAKNFALSGDGKKRRHALRLLLNLWEARRTGRFNPVLSFEQKLWLAVAMSDFESAYEQMLQEV